MRVPRAWGAGGEEMAAGAHIPLPYPDVAVVERDSVEEQIAAVAEALPATPIPLGGCCCAHVGAARGLSGRGGRLSLVWIDAHGDLNTPETSPSGNPWGMSFRMILDAGYVVAGDAALVGARNLDPPEREYLDAHGIDGSVERALAGTAATYVALDLDVFDPSEVDVLFPEADGPEPEEIAALLEDLSGRATIVGMGVTGFLPSERNAALVARMLAAAGL